MDGSNWQNEYSSGFALYLLGPPHFRLGDATPELRRRKVTALLVYVAMKAQRQSRDTLTDLLFPEQDRNRAGAGFRQTLSLPEKSDREKVA